MLAASPSVVLTPRPPFDASPILTYLSRSPLEPLEVVTDGRYRRAVRLAGRPVLIEVVPEGTVEAPRLTVRVLGDDADASLLALAADEVARWWRIEHDPAELVPLGLRD